MRIESSYSNVLNQLNSVASSAQPSSIPISEQMSSQARGLDQGTRNAQDAVSLAQTADGALQSVTDSLGRMRELAVQASNGILTASDKKSIQSEINSLKSGISDALRNTEFNTISIFDGYSGNIQTGANSGQGQQMVIENTSLSSLGISGFDVTGSFDINDIDKALEKINETRSTIGATSNSLESNIRYNEIARENTLSSRSNVIDEDVEKSIIELRQEQLKQQFSIKTQLLKQEQERNQYDVTI